MPAAGETSLLDSFHTKNCSAAQERNKRGRNSWNMLRNALKRYAPALKAASTQIASVAPRMFWPRR